MTTDFTDVFGRYFENSLSETERRDFDLRLADDAEFSEAFAAQPLVHVSLTMWDMGSDSNARADIRAENVTETGFDLVFRTWSVTRVGRVSARWLAIGGVAHPEQWDIY